MEMQLKRSKALSFALVAALAAVLSASPAAFADEAQEPAEQPSQALALAAGAAGEDTASVQGLQAAIDAAADGVQTTVVLTGDIVFESGQIVTVPAGKDIVLDMAGHSITGTDSYSGRPIVNEGTLAITGEGSIDTSMSTKGFGAINNKGTLTIENGTYAGYWLASGSAIRNTGSAAVLTINGGTYSGTCAIYNEGAVSIKDGNFLGETCSQCNSSIWSYTIRNANVDSSMVIDGGYFEGVQGAVSSSVGKLVINDGHFKTVKCKHNPNHTATFYALYAAGEQGAVELTINGGTFETEGTVTAALIGNDGGDGGIGAKATATINGGTFKAPDGVPAFKSASKTGDPVISGGTFLSGDKPFEIGAEYLAPGMSQDENGTVVVDEASSVASVTKDGVMVGAYPTLEEAIAAAKDCGVVTLLSNLTADQVSAGKDKFINITAAGTDVTIDLNGFSIEMDAADTISVSAPDVNLVVKNGTITNINKDSYGLYTYATNDNINVTLEDLTLRTVDQAIGVQGMNSNQNVVLKNCDIKCETTAVYWPPKSGVLTIEDTSIEAKSGVTIKGGAVVVKGDTHIKATGEKAIPEDYYDGSPNGNLISTGAEAKSGVTIKGGAVVVKGDTHIKATGEKAIPEDYYDGSPNGNLISTGAAIYVESGYNDRDISLDLQSGTFESEQGNTVLYFAKEGEATSVDRDIAISGGTFIGEAPAPEFIVPGTGLQLDEHGNLAAVSAQLVPVADKVVDGVHVYDVKNGMVDEAYLLSLMGMNVDIEKSGYKLAVDPTNLDALNEAISARDADATFDFVYTASKESDDAVDSVQADVVDPVTVTVKLTDSSTVPGGDGDEDEGEGQEEGDASTDKPSTDGDKLPATGDAAGQVAGAAAAAGLAAMAAVGGEGQEEGDASTDKPSTDGDKLPATGDAAGQVAGAAAAAGLAAMAAVGAMAVRRKQN